jgi:hypothetical protein
MNMASRYTNNVRRLTDMVSHYTGIFCRPPHFVRRCMAIYCENTV